MNVLSRRIDYFNQKLTSFLNDDLNINSFGLEISYRRNGYCKPADDGDAPDDENLLREGIKSKQS